MTEPEDDLTEPPDEDERPYVCPGCHAVGGEPCLPGCIDAELEADRDADRARGWGEDEWDDSDDGGDGDDCGCELPAADDGGDDVLNAVALLEAALEAPGLLPQIEALEAELEGSDDFPGARSCVGCRELVLDDFDHDFCGDEEPTVKMPRRALGGLPPPPRVWKDELLCPGCSEWRPIELTAPPDAEARNIISSTSLGCACGVSTTVAYSWRRGAVVAVRFEKKRKDQVLN